jgi:PTH1 family peptidyl-tRNA hydrolase
MKLVVGLGNIGSHYAHTRHNAGFMVTDEIARTHGANWKLEPKLHAEVASITLESTKVVLAKPQTMMNLSGDAVGRLMQLYKIAPEDVWVILDDVDVPFGRLRVRQGGSSGHQGIRSIATHVGEDFIRARFGISLNNRAVEPSEVYVLKPFTEDERTDLPSMVQRAAQIITEQLLLDQPTESTFELLAERSA